MSAIIVGPYEFTVTDARQTLSRAGALFDRMLQGLPDALVDDVAPLRAEAEEAAASDRDLKDALGGFWGAWRSAMVALRESGAFGPSAIGTATGLFRGGGGVPKHSVDAVEVGFGGVAGDRQAHRRYHGRPWQALCLWSSGVVDELRSEGHPIAPGLAGENVSITGIAWERVRPGVHLRLGDVLAEVSAYTTPCKQNAAWFRGGDFDVMHIRNGPRSRVYATVLEPGPINRGDPVLLEPGN